MTDLLAERFAALVEPGRGGLGRCASARPPAQTPAHGRSRGGRGRARHGCGCRSRWRLALHQARRHRERPNLRAVPRRELHGLRRSCLWRPRPQPRSLQGQAVTRGGRATTRVRKRQLRPRRTRRAAPNPRCQIHRPRPARRSPEPPTFEAGGEIVFGDARPDVGRVELRDRNGHTFSTATAAAPLQFQDAFRVWVIALPVLDRHHHLGLRPTREADDARAVLPDQKHLAALSLRRAPGIEPIQQRLSP